MELKPCPFCGGEAVLRSALGKLFISPLHKKGCVIEPNTWLQSEMKIEKQIEAWNRRADNDENDAKNPT